MTGRINVSDFDLPATLECGQAFRWSRHGENGWFVGVVGKQIWRLRQSGDTLEWEASTPHPNPLPQTTAASRGLGSPASGAREPHSVPSPVSCTGEGQGEGSRFVHYLSLDRSLAQITASFPADDQHLHAAVHKHWGLRVLRQEPWECLASFMASSTKQIVQIRQIVAELSRRFGEPIADADGRARWPQRGRDAVPRVRGRAAARPYHSFPSVGAIARASHQELWDCKLGFRAKNLLAAARMIEGGKVNFRQLPAMEYERALEELLKLPGVGEKIANCVLLFSCGFEQAFPVDVWIERALRRLYFGGSGLHPRSAGPSHGGVALEKRSHEKVTARQLRDFARNHFGLYAGWAQQYLFLSERTTGRGR